MQRIKADGAPAMWGVKLPSKKLRPDDAGDKVAAVPVELRAAGDVVLSVLNSITDGTATHGSRQVSIANSGCTVRYGTWCSGVIAQASDPSTGFIVTLQVPGDDDLAEQETVEEVAECQLMSLPWYLNGGKLNEWRDIHNLIM